MRIGYARVSTSDQKLEPQLTALDGAGCDRIFSEHASGARSARPQLDAMLAFAREGDVIVAVKLDRIMRSLRHLLDLSAVLAGRGIGLVILDQQIDTTTSMGRLFFSVIGAFAEFERDLCVERTREGLAAARARGNVGGRPPVIPEEKLATAKALILNENVPVADACRDLGGISKKSYYRYRRRFLEEGAA